MMARDTENGDSTATTMWLVLGVVAVIGIGVMLFREGEMGETGISANTSTNAPASQEAPATQTNTTPNEPQPSSAPPEQPAP
jgi:hypothetical protein